MSLSESELSLNYPEALSRALIAVEGYAIWAHRREQVADRKSVGNPI